MSWFLGTKKDNRKKAAEAPAGLLLCLLALALLPEASSSITGFKAVNSSGSLSYAVCSLLVTDSTPEGPVPYTLDGSFGYQTGSTYTLSVGNHLVQMPSPHTALSSGITYNFTSWQDGPTTNPRTISLSSGATMSLDAIYAEAGTSPPQPPSNGALLGRTSFDNGVTWWDVSAGTLPVYDSIVGSGFAQITTEDKHSGTSSFKMVKSDSNERTSFLARPTSNLVEFYTAAWYKITSAYGFTWWQWHEMRRNNAGIGSGEEVNAVYIDCDYVGGTPYFFFFHGSNQWAGVSFTARSDTGEYTATTGTVRMPYQTTVPLNKWFKFEWYVKRGISDGIVRAWITEEGGVRQQLIEALNVQTSWYAPTNMEYVAPLKLYCGEVGSDFHGTLIQYVDDWEVWNGLPP